VVKLSVVIFNGSLGEHADLYPIQKTLESEFIAIGLNVDSYILHKIKIKSCIGCFKCWHTTPGICSGIKDDAAEEIKKRVINSDLIVFLTPITFGGYSSEIKKIFERLLGILQPGMQIINDETHHLRRYDKYPSILAIGVSGHNEQEEEELFKKLVYRNSLNFYPPKYWTIIIKDKIEHNNISQEITQIIKEMELRKQ
jgi:multimeric flavodoxin WrbA